MTSHSHLVSKLPLYGRHGIRGLVIDPYNELEQQRGSHTETEYISALLGKVRTWGGLVGPLEVLTTQVWAHGLSSSSGNLGAIRLERTYATVYNVRKRNALVRLLAAYSTEEGMTVHMRW